MEIKKMFKSKNEFYEPWNAFLNEMNNNDIKENIFISLLPHPITLNDGTVIEPSGDIARVSATFSSFDNNGICEQSFGAVSGLPGQKQNTFYIVSALVLAAVKETSGRKDVIAPATGHPEAKRTGGQISSVPGFVR